MSSRKVVYVGLALLSILPCAGCKTRDRSTRERGTTFPSVHLSKEAEERLERARKRWHELSELAKMGMSKQEAIDAMGAPSSRRSCERLEEWRYDIDGDVCYMLWFEGDNVVGYGGGGPGLLYDVLLEQAHRRALEEREEQGRR